MIGQVHEQLPGGAGTLTHEEADDGRGRDPAASSDLVDPDVAQRAVVVRPEDVDVVIAPEWLADLHDPTLVISHGYVGPDRRRRDRSAPATREFTGWWWRLTLVAVLTALLAVPVTLLVVRSLPTATSVPAVVTAARSTPSRYGAGASGRAAARAATASARAAARSATASARAAARADTASARAAAREAGFARAAARADTASARAAAREAGFARVGSVGRGDRIRVRSGPGSARVRRPGRGAHTSGGAGVAPTTTRFG